MARLSSVGRDFGLPSPRRLQHKRRGQLDGKGCAPRSRDVRDGPMALVVSVPGVTVLAAAYPMSNGLEGATSDQ